MCNEFAVEKGTAHAVADRASRCEESHDTFLQLLVVDTQAKGVRCPKQKEVAVFEVKSDHPSSEAPS